MLRRHRKSPQLRAATERNRTASINSTDSTGALLVSGLCLLSACSFHAGFQTSTGSTTPQASAQNEQPRTRAPRNTQNSDNQPAVRSRRHVRTQPEADDELARIDRETRERVAQAEREAEEQERAAEAEAERARQQAEADRAAAANQAAANTTPAIASGDAMKARVPGNPTNPTGTPAQTAAQSGAADARKAGNASANTSASQGGAARRNDPSHAYIHTNPNPATATPEQNAIHDRFVHANEEIDRTVIEKKTTIRKRLEQNKADILVAAERKRNEIHASLKQDAAEKR